MGSFLCCCGPIAGSRLIGFGGGGHVCRGGGGGGGGEGKGSETEGVLWVLLELKQHPVLLSGEQITMAQVQVVQSVDLSGHRLHHHNNSSLTKRCRIK